MIHKIKKRKLEHKTEIKPRVPDAVCSSNEYTNYADKDQNNSLFAKNGDA